jgi:hypothetical protein
MFEHDRLVGVMQWNGGDELLVMGGEESDLIQREGVPCEMPPL